MLGVTVDTDVLARRLAALNGRDLTRSVGIAISRAGISTRAAVRSSLRGDLTLKAGTITSAITLERSLAQDGANRASVVLRAQGGPLPLSRYQASMTKRGATFRILKAAPRRVYRQGDRTGFIIGTRSGASSGSGRRSSGRFQASERFGGNVFVRGASSRAIHRVFGPGIAQRVAGGTERNRAARVFRDRFTIEFRSALQEFIRRNSQGGGSRGRGRR